MSDIDKRDPNKPFDATEFWECADFGNMPALYKGERVFLVPHGFTVVADEDVCHGHWD